MVRFTACLSMALAALGPGSGRGDEPPPSDLVRCRNGAVVSVSRPASEAGLEVLRRGGNAVDAAVATAVALAVVWPEAGNIGGGGYLLIVPAESADETAGQPRRITVPTAIDFRETAPAAATRDMFVGPEGRTPHRRVGVPGTVRGLALAQARFGLRPWRETLAPAVSLAKEGFALDAATARSINDVLKSAPAERFAELHRVFGRPDGESWKAGDRLVQPDLAETLERIAERGPDGFYAGKTADLIAAEMGRGGGLITTADLAGYVAKIRRPIHGTYRGHDVYSSPPSSSGGTTLVQALNILETCDLRSMGPGSPEARHRMIEAARRAYRTRARWLGDPDFVEIPGTLTSKEFARELAATIDPERATPSTRIAGDIELSTESEQTTHFSVIDRNGTAVSCTYTLESSWGSRVVVRGAGFVLNDELNDFNWLPGVTDRTGRIGTEANTAAPGKRPLSSMCPTVVAREGRPVLITGSPGGRTIINTILCVIVHTIDFELPLRDAVDAPRLHHQWLPDVTRIEPDFLKQFPETIRRLREMGHDVREAGRQGDAHSIAIDPKSGEITAAADRRRNGHAAGY